METAAMMDAEGQGVVYVVCAAFVCLHFPLTPSVHHWQDLTSSASERQSARNKNEAQKLVYNNYYYYLVLSVLIPYW